MRDVIRIPLQKETSLIIASDNSGGVGMKPGDLVHVPYEQVAYYSFRVAVMECIAAGGVPVAVVLHNFCGNEPWKDMLRGINRGLQELHLQEVPITGSTESNFSLSQSALGLLVLGQQQPDIATEIPYREQWQYAVIGSPLVGNEVIEKESQIAPLGVFQQICRLHHVTVWPVGSKGIQYELNQMDPEAAFNKVTGDIDVVKSSGPATCFICAFPPDLEKTIKQLAAGYFHPLLIET